jgi:ADP-heptose:LPS heptosyltransferase/O-antigen/teichoic acid export membrane protein
MIRAFQAELKRDDRLARVFKGGLSGFAGKLITLLVNAISLPLTVRYLGPEQYGIWVTISTTIVMFAVMDLGVAFTLTNLIARAYADDDRAAAQRYYATAFWTSTVISTTVGAIAILLWPRIDWGTIFHVHDVVLIRDVSRYAAVALGFFLLSIPLNLVHRVLGGYQQTQITNYFNMFRNALSLVAILVVVRLHGSLFMLILIYSSSLIAGTLGLNLWMNLWDRRWIFPSPRYVRRDAIGNLLGSGSGFLLLQIAGLIVFNSDNIVITHYLGAAAVAPYSVTWRLAAYAVVLQNAVSPSLWPAYSEAYARGDLAWMRKTFWRMARVIGWTTFSGLFLFAIFGHMLIGWYVGPAATPTYALLWAICGWTMISACMDLEACLLAAIGRIHAQGILSLIAAAINILLSIYLVKRIGSIGAVAGTAISYILILIIPQTIIVWNALYPRVQQQAEKGTSRQRTKGKLKLSRRLFETLLLHSFRLLVWLSRAVGLLPRPTKTSQQRQRLLVIHLTPHLGDSVMLMPVLERLRESQPEVALELAIGAQVAPLFEVLPWLDRVYSMNIPVETRAVRGFSILRLWQVTRAYYQTMTNVSADICLIPRWCDDSFRSQNMAYLIGSTRRIGWKEIGSRYRDGLLTEAYQGGSGMHESDRFCLLATSAGLIPHNASNEISDLPVASMQLIADEADWPALARRLRVDRELQFAVISPGASLEAKRWPVERWLDVMSWLRKRNLEIVLQSGPDDADIADQLHALDGRKATLVAGKTAVAESVTLISHATLFLGNDSGPGHVAGSLGVPTLVIFSSPEGCHTDVPTGPERNRPLGPKITFCQPARSAEPCGQYCLDTKDNCIQGVSVDQVLLQLEALWERYGSDAKQNRYAMQDGIPVPRLAS